MSEFHETIKMYFSFSFVQYAFIAGIMIVIVSSLLGITLVLKRFSYIGDGLSHTAFGAMAMASVLKISHSIIFVLPVTVFFAILILCTIENGKTIILFTFVLIFASSCNKKNDFTSVDQNWDLTGCCPSGLNFIPPDSMIYPYDFPEAGAFVTVTGTMEKAFNGKSNELYFFMEDCS